MQVMTLQETYNKDLYLWGQKNINLLKQGRLSELDIEHLIEEIEDMGRSQRHAIQNHLKNLIMHLLKWQFQSDIQSHSWKTSILNARIEINDLIDESPSLHNVPTHYLEKAYSNARELASSETNLSLKTFPLNCPYTIEEILKKDWFPNA
ncbi:MAG: hypothetical protein RL344_634 [Pseudomonadota bacterium]|jgi:hypothetical protein